MMVPELHGANHAREYRRARARPLPYHDVRRCLLRGQVISAGLVEAAFAEFSELPNQADGSADGSGHDGGMGEAGCCSKTSWGERFRGGGAALADSSTNGGGGLRSTLALGAESTGKARAALVGVGSVC